MGAYGRRWAQIDTDGQKMRRWSRKYTDGRIGLVTKHRWFRKCTDGSKMHRWFRKRHRC